MSDAKRTRVLIGAMAGVIVLLVVALAFPLGRPTATPAAPPAHNTMTAQPPPAAPVNQTAAAAPAPASDRDDALSRWLAGGWAEESTNCQTDGGVWYDPSGRFGASGQEGLWRVENGTLVVTVTHEAVGDPLAEDYIGLPNPETRRFGFTRESQDRMILVVEGRPVRMVRCPLAHRSFAT